MTYTTPLSWSGQFPHCSLPLRLDAYRGCGFSCDYCFARARGGNVPDQRVVPAESTALERAFVAAENGSTTIVSQSLRQRVPIHFGGMSDPFQPVEARHRVSLAFLKTLANRAYPTVLSTKGDLAAAPEYTDVLRANPHTVVQISLVSTSDSLASKIEPHATPPSRLLRLAETLSGKGLRVAIRLQPYLSSVCGSLSDYVRAIASVGALNASIEHLKVPVESSENPLIEKARNEYRRSGGTRDGREFVLPPSRKLDRILEMRSLCHDVGIAFGCADNEYQYLSDFAACCSGVDAFPGFENFFRFQIAFAIRQSRTSDVSMASIKNEWRPVGSVDRFLNSRTRLGGRTGHEGTVERHIEYRWNNPNASGSPATFAGIKDSGKLDADGNRIYCWS